MRLALIYSPTEPIPDCSQGMSEDQRRIAGQVDATYRNFQLDVTRPAVGEPTTIALLGLGLAGLASARRRKAA